MQQLLVSYYWSPGALIHFTCLKKKLEQEMF